MPRKFTSIEVLPHDPPFSPALVAELGLRGINCGSARGLFPGWMNTDLAHLRAWNGDETQPGRITLIDGGLHYLEFDSREPYPFEDESFEWVYSEHFVEHLDLEEVIGWLADVRRLLKPGGRVRLSTPDLRLYVEGYLDPGNGFFAEHRERLSKLRVFAETGVPDRPAWMVNQIFRRWRHRWIFDFEELAFAAERAGFDAAAVERRSFSEGAEPEVAALDSPGHNDESLYVEMTRT
jgi:predicted SAM-dependent methyltransferase